jgi:ElaB/YqjD/DUF883 family membrane-anchored ribosome-binding protein
MNETMTPARPFQDTRNFPPNDTVEAAAQAAHQTADRIADKATEQVDKVSGTLHRAVNSAADAANVAAGWASTLPDQAQQAKARFTESASEKVRANPIAAVAGAVALGYLLGRLAR